MKVNSLISDIIRGEWLIDIHNLEAYNPIISKLLAGEQLNLERDTKSILNFIDQGGNVVKENEEGVVLVPKGSIAVVKMIGEVVKYGDFCVYGADEIVAALTQANNMKNVLATIFIIDGPGGSVSSIGPFQYFAKNIKSKPIIGLCDQALSLHYWTAVEVCDHIMADNNVSARFGSVGVVLTFADNRKAMEEKGIKFHEVYPVESEYKNKAFALAREGKYEMIREEFLSPLAKNFQSRVKANRPNLLEEVGVLSGKTFFADEALRLGMIDSIGGMQSAVRQAVILSSINKFNN
ncbi:S49 family peptidase [Lutibacter sp.]|uniref:S49 family peptidase n=1 Tax=Lutibacter sp. TaxID=1925666 RepID=UPI003563064D